MAKPIESDFINAHLISQRILLRKMFETLRDRPQSKYFKNIIIKDVEWSKKTFSHNATPLNFPKKFLDKYPFDFEISFTTLGCNMLKCFTDYRKYTAKSSSSPLKPVIINDYIFGGGEACLAVYEEFNSYVREKFNLVAINTIDNNNDDNYLPFETFSVYDKIKNQNYCAIQLTPLKTFSILPSSRWQYSENEEEGEGGERIITAREYFKRYKNSSIPPLQMRELAGLVDAPPLTWNLKKQNAHFNSRYCARFNKTYDDDRDECCQKNFVRTGLNYLLGESFVNNAFPTLENMLIYGSFPFEHLHDRLKLNFGYSEKSTTQSNFESKIFVNEPDLSTEKSHVIDNSAALFQRKKQKMAAQINNIFAEIASQLAIDASIEASFTVLPNVTARLLKHYSTKFLHRALLIQHSSSLPVSIRLFSLTARAVINQLTIKMAIKMLTLISSAANVLFMVTFITLIPDILFAYYNIGGYNNEITRQHLNQQRKSNLENLLKSSLKQYGDQLVNYVVLDDGDYVSPIVTPELIYYLCLLNFLKHNPDKAVDICHTALANDDDYEEIALYYINCLEINGIGQRIVYKKYDKTDASAKQEEDDDDDDIFIKNVMANVSNSDNKSLADLIINYQIDVYFLLFATVLLLLVTVLVLLSNSYTLFACILLYTSLLLYLIWFTLFLPLFN